MKLNQLKKHFLLLFFAFITAGNLFAQSTQGTDFWVAFGQNLEFDASELNLQLRVGGSPGTTGQLTFTIALPDVNFTIPESGVYTHVLTSYQRDAVYPDAPITEISYKSLHVHTSAPVSVYALNQHAYSTDATNVLPETACGSDYYQISYLSFEDSESDLYETGDYDKGSDGCTLVALHDGTNIYINGSNTPANATPLHRGDVFSYYGAFGSDLTGTRVTSNQPIAYFVTNALANIPAEAAATDCLYQQLPPIPHWGSNFVIPNTAQGVGRIRVLASQNGTTITQTGATLPSTVPEGSKNSLNLNAGQWVELEIGVGGCFIAANNPIGVCAYMVGDGYTLSVPNDGDPAMAWISPIEQRINNVLIAPFIPATQTALKYHYALLVAPTFSADQTTVSIGSGNPTSLGNVTWTALTNPTNPYESYSFCSYPLSDNTYDFNNPFGLIVGGYGYGRYESYYYLAGSAARDLRADLLINDESYVTFNDTKIGCGTFNFKAELDLFPLSNDPNINTIRWHLNGQEMIAHQGKREWSTPLSPGDYELTLTLTDYTNFESQLIVQFTVSDSPIVWTPEANAAGTDADKQSWNNATNWTPEIIPTACNDVYIPGNSTHYPQLTTTVACKDIYFMQGAELGRPDLLIYEQTHVHFNFNLSQTSQAKETNPTALHNLVIDSEKTADRLKFSASTSTSLSRERWHALSAPLRNVVSGDFSFGSFPLTFLMKFGPIVKDGTNYHQGTWTTPYSSFTEPIGPTDGFGFYMYGYDAGENADHNLGCEELGYFNTLNDMTYLPAIRAGHAYGIQKSNGILELPFFADSLNMEAHRTQVYTPASGQSEFYYVSDGTYNNGTSVSFNHFTGNSDAVTRENNGGNYRFTTETYNTGNWVFQNPILHSGAGLTDNDEFLVGNPYMSSIDMVEFYKDNIATIYPEFKIWDGTTFNSYNVNIPTGDVTPTVPGNSRYIAPLQGFFLTSKGGDVKFDVTKISAVRPHGTTSNLRSSQTENAENNILRIKAENTAAVSYMLIAHKQGANNAFLRGEDVRKLFSPYDYVPEIYALAGETPVDIDFINSSGDITVPLGIKTKQLENTKFTFSGMDHYSQVSKIIFEDRLLNKKIDLTGKNSFTYSFANQVEGVQNGRFFLRFSQSPTAIENLKDLKDLKVFKDASGTHITTEEKIERIIFYDLQGRKVDETAYIGSGYYTVPAELFHGIAKVITVQGVKSIKF